MLYFAICVFTQTQNWIIRDNFASIANWIGELCYIGFALSPWGVNFSSWVKSIQICIIVVLFVILFCTRLYAFSPTLRKIYNKISQQFKFICLIKLHSCWFDLRVTKIPRLNHWINQSIRLQFQKIKHPSITDLCSHLTFNSLHYPSPAIIILNMSIKGRENIIQTETWTDNTS